MSSNELHDRALFLCARLREEREKTGLDQKDFAELVGIKPRTYMTYENKVPIPSDKLNLISEKSDLDVFYVLTGSRMSQAKVGIESNQPLINANQPKIDVNTLKKGIKKFFDESLMMEWVFIPKDTNHKMVFDFMEFCLRKESGEKVEFQRPTSDKNKKSIKL